MDILRGKTPEMVRKEIYVHLLAYNLLRTLMWQGGQETAVNPLFISLLETRNHFLNFLGELKNKKGHKRRLLYQELLEIIGNATLLKRVGRYEPRVKKRRPKSYPLMTKPRSNLRKKMVS